MIGIYKITSPSGKVYIGQTLDMDKRVLAYSRHDCKKQIRLYASFKKYGFDNHDFEIIHKCEISDLNRLERYYQDLYNCTGKFGLNCRLTEMNGRSGKLSKDTCAKISLSQKGRQGRSGKDNGMFGRKHSAETRAKIVLKNTGRKASDETKLKMSLTKKGRKQNDEWKRKRTLNSIKVVLDFSTGFYYNSGLEAAIAMGLKPTTMYSYLNKQRKNKTSLMYV